MPLVQSGALGIELAVGEAHERARKIKPQYAEGDLVRVAGGRNQAEAEMIQGILLDEGIPSLLRRARGFDVPDMLAAGPRDVMTPASGAPAARDVLLQAQLLTPEQFAAAGQSPPIRVLAGLMLAVALVAVVAWLGTELLA
jgi:hypothetical protein